MKLTFKHVALLTISLCLLLSATSHAQFFSKQSNPLLPEDEAFDVFAQIEDDTLRVNWIIAQDYYMYRDQFDIQSTTPGVEIGEINFPKGEIEDDPEFGQVEVYFFNATLTAPIVGDSKTIELVIKGQGCNKPVGVCYPPQMRNLTVQYNATDNRVTTPSLITNSTQSTKSESAPQPQASSFLGYVLAALAAGILLSFTPCVLPMIPILAGLIAGQKNPSRLQSGWLAICYVAGTIITYAIAGWVAGASGTQLQAHFQNPWVIGTVCSILFLLALSLFGAFKIQLPSSIQTKLNGTSVSNRSASISSLLLGLISALVVGACVSPVLIITLGAAISQGNPILGASIMAAMAFGMGLLLIVFGFGAGWLLPKTGAWMNHIQILFGFMVIGVAIFLISTLSVMPTLYLWAAILISSGFYLFKITDEINSALINSLIKAAALIILLWGCLSLIGATVNNDDDVLKPLSGFSVSNGSTISNIGTAGLPFQKTTTLNGVKPLLDAAKSAGKPVLIDFYADWCLDCKRMERTTLKEPQIAQALNGWELIKIDVTDTSELSEEVKRYFGVFGPPATLFFNQNGEEHSDLRQYGYMNKEVLLNLINKAQE